MKKGLLVFVAQEAQDSRRKYYDRIHKTPNYPKWPKLRLSPPENYFLDLLPLVRGRNELLIEITSFLAPKEYISLSLTCKKFGTSLSSLHVIHSFRLSVEIYCERKLIPFKLEKPELDRMDKEPQLLLQYLSNTIASARPPIQIRNLNSLRSRSSKSIYEDVFSKSDQLFFYDEETGEFGDANGDVYYFSGRLGEFLKHSNTNFKKHKLKSVEGMEMDYLDGNVIDLMKLRPIPTKKTTPKSYYGAGSYSPIFFMDHNSRDNPLRLLTHTNNRIALFSFSGESSLKLPLDISYDWLFTRSVVVKILSSSSSSFYSFY